MAVTSIMDLSKVKSEGKTVFMTLVCLYVKFYANTCSSHQVTSVKPNLRLLLAPS